MAQTCSEGLRLGEYRILRALGEGPYTFACLAESIVPPHRRVVVKGLKDPDLAPCFASTCGDGPTTPAGWRAW